MKRLAIALTACALTGCATAYPVQQAYTDAPPQAPTLGQVLLGAAADFLISTNPNRHVTTVWIGRERHTVTTTTSADGRRGTVRVSP